jgi:hypothetical protein
MGSTTAAPRGNPPQTAQAMRQAILGTPQQRAQFARTAQQRSLQKRTAPPSAAQLHAQNTGSNVDTVESRSATTARRQSMQITQVPALSATTLNAVGTRVDAPVTLPPPTAPRAPLEPTQKKIIQSTADLSQALGPFSAAFRGGKINWGVLGRLISSERMKNVAKIMRLQQQITNLSNKVMATSADTNVLMTEGDVISQRIHAAIQIVSGYLDAKTAYEKGFSDIVSDILPSSTYENLDVLSPSKPHIAPIEDIQRINAMQIVAGHDVEEVNVSKILAEKNILGDKNLAVGTKEYEISAAERALCQKRRLNHRLTDTTGLLTEVPDESGKMIPIKRALFSATEVHYLAQCDLEDGGHTAARYVAQENRMMGARQTDNHGKLWLFTYEASVLRTAAEAFEKHGMPQQAAAARVRAVEFEAKCAVAETALNVAVAHGARTDDGLGRNLQVLRYLKGGIEQMEKEELKVKVRPRGANLSAEDRFKENYSTHLKQSLLGQAFVLTRALSPYVQGPGSLYAHDAQQQRIRTRQAVADDTTLSTKDRQETLAWLDQQIREAHTKASVQASRPNDRSKHFHTGETQAAYDAMADAYDKAVGAHDDRGQKNAARGLYSFKAQYEAQWQACELSRCFHQHSDDPDPVRAKLAGFLSLTGPLMERHAKARLQKTLGTIEEAAQGKAESLRQAAANAKQPPAKPLEAQLADLEKSTEAERQAAHQMAQKEGRFYSNKANWVGRPTAHSARPPGIQATIDRLSKTPAAFVPAAGVRPDLVRPKVHKAADEAVPPATKEAMFTTPWANHPDDIPVNFAAPKEVDDFLQHSVNGAMAAMSGYRLTTQNYLAKVPGAQALVKAMGGLPVLGPVVRTLLADEWNQLQARTSIKAGAEQMQQVVGQFSSVTGGLTENFAQETGSAAQDSASGAINDAANLLPSISALNTQLIAMTNKITSWN